MNSPPIPASGSALGSLSSVDLSSVRGNISVCASSSNRR